MFQRFLCVVGMCSLLLPVEAQSSKNLRGINKQQIIRILFLDYNLCDKFLRL